MTGNTPQLSLSLNAHTPKITARQAIDFFASNPDILMQHPSLLAELLLPHSNDPASLVLRQLELLRQRNQAMHQTLSDFIQIAKDNEAYFQAANQLAFSLISSRNQQDFFDRLHRELIQNFQLDYVQLHLLPQWSPSAKAMQNDRTSTWVWSLATLPYALWQRFSCHADMRRNILIGPLRTGDQQALFAGKDTIDSAVVIELRTSVPVGLLCLGRSDPKAFRPTQDRLFLHTLQEGLSRLIAQQLGFLELEVSG